MNVKELAHLPAVTCLPGTTLAQAARLMARENVGCLVVIDEHGRLTGIVTDRDMITRGTAADLDPGAPVRAVMTTQVSFVYEDADVFSATAEMATRGVRRLPLVDIAGRVAGMITLDDLSVAFTDQLARLARAVRKEILTAPVPG